MTDDDRLARDELGVDDEEVGRVPDRPRSRNAADREELSPSMDRGPDGRDRTELGFFARHRAAMDNDELQAFLEEESVFHERLDEADEGVAAFADWEERILLQRHDQAPAAIADSLERDPAAVEAKMAAMGLTELDDDPTTVDVDDHRAMD